MITKGDCLIELRKLHDQSVDLVYLDPPFYTQKKQQLRTRDTAKEYSFEDIWEDIESYKNYITERLIECQRVLKSTGSIFLHCDRTASHHLRVVLDEVFGMSNFQSEIIWAYKRWSNAKNGLLNAHQVIYFYSKTPHFKFNKVFESYSPTTNIDQIFQKRARGANGKTAYKQDKNGGIELMKEKMGVPLSDVWEIPFLNPKASERVGYPTQKPVILLERIIHLATDTDDLVLDPFCGSGTTLVAASLLGRKYIGIDISQDAIDLTKKRLIHPMKTESALLKKGKEAYLNQDKKILEMLNGLDVMPVQRNKGIDGFLKIGKAVKAVPVKIQREQESLEAAKQSLMRASNRSGFGVAILIKTNNLAESLLFSSPERTYKNLVVVDGLQKISQIRKELELSM